MISPLWARAETIEAPSQTEMREILGIAIEKENRHLLELMSSLGLLRPSEERSSASDREAFRKQVEEILDKGKAHSQKSP